MMSYADYLMIISPPDDLIKEVNRYKRASVNAIGHFEGMHSMAHITITHQTRCKPFLAHPAIMRMGERLSTMPPVELFINRFDFFNHGQSAKTIYAKIERTERCDNWFQLLTMQMGIKVHNLVPHITIASNIPVTAFNKLWPNFEGKEFKRSFIVSNLTILQRDTYAEYRKWEVYKELHFGNKLLAF